MLSRNLWVGVLALSLFVVALTPHAARAQPVEVPDTYAGDLGSRPRLTGNWGGLRDDLAKRGITLDVDLLQIVQGVASGGLDEEADYSGSVDYTLNVDTGKLGLWPGGFLKLHAESSFGESVNREAGALSAVNADALFPVPGDPSTTLTHLTFTQFLSPWFGIFAGKIEAYDAGANEFADDHRTKFLNIAFDFPMVAARAPISALGGGLILLPFEGAVFTAMALDSNGRTTEAGFDDAFDDGVTVVSEGRVSIKPFGLPGHQLVGFLWNTKDFISLEQDPRTLLGRLLVERFPRLGVQIPVGDIKTEADTWAFYYNFDQYLWTRKADPTQGVGVFFKFGVSDGKANPIKYHYNVGIAGKGLIPGRPRDTFGIGWSFLELSDDLFPILRRQLAIGLEEEHVVELFYNISVTPWLNVTADLQIVDLALEKTPPTPLEDVDTAVVAGLRVYARF